MTELARKFIGIFGKGNAPESAQPPDPVVSPWTGLLTKPVLATMLVAIVVGGPVLAVALRHPTGTPPPGAASAKSSSGAPAGSTGAASAAAAGGAGSSAAPPAPPTCDSTAGIASGGQLGDVVTVSVTCRGAQVGLALSSRGYHLALARVLSSEKAVRPRCEPSGIGDAGVSCRLLTRQASTTHIATATAPPPHAGMRLRLELDFPDGGRTVSTLVVR